MSGVQSIHFEKLYRSCAFYGVCKCKLHSKKYFKNSKITYALQRHNTENSKQMFPKMKLGCLVPNSYIHVSSNVLYIPTIGLPVLLQKIGGPIVGINKSLVDTWMWKLILRPCNFFSGGGGGNAIYLYPRTRAQNWQVLCDSNKWYDC